ncbi:ribose 5-phosphate isomerase B [Phaeovibrio sulfidiphilus]|uniref:Ribose 5-phosphate isomerase B n=1 Tax=Phaeovibrio sulfidiphilus TaxID=1220600 RepID=A0A8J6YIF2_9PROT|nr:ribose 5-phosphate isomerase B [Phaeovibrio sulfidiphilus]MBE1236831.1 ribose 5-phosphate isomerase B [Phaeovibrio sulfidiphilus]
MTPHDASCGCAGTPARPTVAFASDHGAVELRQVLIDHLQGQGYPVIDLGTEPGQSVDYPDVAEQLVKTLRKGTATIGVLLCGTGIGISIALNRHADMRGALVHDAYGARMARAHNNANVLVLGGRTTGPEVAKECLDIFLATPFEGGRHARRVEKLGAPSGTP